MKEIKEGCYKGTRILLGDGKGELLSRMVEKLIHEDFQEISIPIIQKQELFKNKVGEENNNLMYTFKDKGNRNLCLAPEYTAIIQNLAKTYFKYNKDLKLFYVQECFRGEKPQKGRYRQFTQLGVEILNPTGPKYVYLINLARVLIGFSSIKNITLNQDVPRGLDYYKNGRGFEITSNDTQICGGGEYQGGIGFAIGIDRLI